MTAGRIPLESDPEWEVRVAPKAIADFRDHDNGHALLAACIEVLEQNPYKPTKGKAGLMRGHDPIRKFRPPGFGAYRVYYAIDEDEARLVWLLGVHPRSKNHRPKDLKAAQRRLEKTKAEKQGKSK